VSYVRIFNQNMKRLVEETPPAIISKKTGISLATIFRYVHKGGNPCLSKVDAIEREMKKPAGWAFGFDRPERNHSLSLPVFDNMDDILNTSRANACEYRTISKCFQINSESICYKVNMNSMEPTIKPSDIVILSKVDPKNHVIQGVYFVTTGNGVIMGRVMAAEGGAISIISDNKEYPIITIKDARLVWRIVGIERTL